MMILPFSSLMEKENREADFNQTDIEAAINLLKKNKKPIPYKQIPDLIVKGKNES
jgi:hypothetical protein